MTIRTKLYAAVVVTVAGLALTAGVGIWALTELSSRFSQVQQAADARALALQLKFDVTDFNGWQTAYGYDSGRSRPIFLDSTARFRMELASAERTLTQPTEAYILGRIKAGADDFMRLDSTAWAALRAGRTEEVRRLFLGPEIVNFHRIAAATQELAAAETARASHQELKFKSARKSALRYLILAALVTGLLVALLLITANDLASAAERALSLGRSDLPPSDPT